MRLAINVLIPVMVVSLVAGIVAYDCLQRDRQDTRLTVQQDLVRLRGQAAYHGAMRRTAVTRAGFPRAIRREWFGGESLPVNRLIPGRHCWLDVAPSGDMVDHPPDPIAFRSTQGGFWYNPNIGVVRARVPWQHSVEQALRTYNTLNHTNLTHLPVANPDRRPRPSKLFVPIGIEDSLASASK